MLTAATPLIKAETHTATAAAGRARHLEQGWGRRSSDNLDACQHDCDGQPEQEEHLRVFNTEFKAARTAARAQHSARNK